MSISRGASPTHDPRGASHEAFAKFRDALRAAAKPHAEKPQSSTQDAPGRDEGCDWHRDATQAVAWPENGDIALESEEESSIEGSILETLRQLDPMMRSLSKERLKGHESQ